MRHWFGRPTPATIVALLALVAALGGSAYAAGRIDGRAVKVKSLPGNRLKPGSVPANRLKPGVIPGRRPGSRGRSPAPRSTSAASARCRAPTTPTSPASPRPRPTPRPRLNAVNAVDAETVNGHGAGCLPGTTPFAGACWQTSANETPVTAPVAAAACAAQGGTLPEALAAGGVRAAARRDAEW